MTYIKCFILILFLSFFNVSYSEEKKENDYVIEHWLVTETEISNKIYYAQLRRLTDGETIVIKKYMIKGYIVIGIRFKPDTEKLEYTYFFTSTRKTF